MQANISTNVADIDSNLGNIITNNAQIANNTNEIDENGANIATHDTDIAINVANIASNAVAITNVDAQIEDLQLTGIFENCVNEWCLQNGLTYPQYTKCESTADNGQTCIKPGIRYGI